MSDTCKPRPEFRNLTVFGDLPSYRWPLAALVSGMHRISGVLMFVLLPFILWLFDKSVSSEISFGKFTSAFSSGLGFAPGWLIKLLTLGLIGLFGAVNRRLNRHLPSNTRSKIRLRPQLIR